MVKVEVYKFKYNFFSDTYFIFDLKIKLRIKK